MLGWIGRRSTGEIIVLLITFTVCFGIVASGIAILIIEILHPSTDISLWASRITGLMNTMVGLLAGFLAGRTDYRNQQPPPSDGGDA